MMKRYMIVRSSSGNSVASCPPVGNETIREITMWEANFGDWVRHRDAESALQIQKDEHDALVEQLRTVVVELHNKLLTTENNLRIMEQNARYVLYLQASELAEQDYRLRLIENGK